MGGGEIEIKRADKPTALHSSPTCAGLSPSRKATRMTASEAMNTLSASLLNHVGCAPPRSVTTVTNGSCRLQDTCPQRRGRKEEEGEKAEAEEDKKIKRGKNARSCVFRSSRSYRQKIGSCGACLCVFLYRTPRKPEDKSVLDSRDNCRLFSTAVLNPKSGCRLHRTM